MLAVHQGCWADPPSLRSVAETQRHIAEQIAPRLSRFIAEAKRIAHHGPHGRQGQTGAAERERIRDKD
jgi:hypothetical protein